MSTHAMIGLATATGAVRSIYLHWSGAPRHAGGTLLRYYTTAERVAALIALGDPSELGDAPGDRAHDFHNPTPGVCLAYARDRGEHGGRPRILESACLADFDAHAVAARVAWRYLFTPGPDGTAGTWRAAPPGVRLERLASPWA